MTSAPEDRSPPALVAPNLVLAFLLEILALLILSDWGWHRGEVTGTRLLQAILVPLVAAVVWGLFAAPKARFDLPAAGRLAVKALVFGAAAWALADLGHPVAALVFAVVVVVNTVAATVWERQGYGPVGRSPAGPGEEGPDEP